MDDVERNTRLEVWFRTYGDRVLAYLLHRTDPETAQDVLQEVFVIAFRKANVVPDPPIGWLLGTARRVLANTARGQRRCDHLTVRIADGQRGYQRDDQRGDQPGRLRDDGDPAVADALARLSPADREVLTLSAWYELSADEAAQALHCSRSAYSVRLHRARRRLAERLATAGYAPHDRITEVAHD